MRRPVIAVAFLTAALILVIAGAGWAAGAGARAGVSNQTGSIGLMVHPTPDPHP